VSEVTEYGLRMSDGGFQVRSASPEVEKIYPTADWVAGQMRTGGHVYRRRVIVVGDWEEITELPAHGTWEYNDRMCPACRSLVRSTADGVLAEHDTGTAIPTRCVGSGVTVKGEHQ
jgi:hypothetical protein